MLEDKEIQHPALRYFAYYLATSILGRENTSNTSNYHLAFLAAALNNDTKYNLGSLIARRLAARGPIYEGIIASRMVATLELSVDPNDTVLTPQRLDLAAMKTHHFVTADSSMEGLVYKMLFTDGDEREIPLPQSTLFSIYRRPWSCSKEEVDEQLRLLGFHRQHQEDVPSYDYSAHYGGASSSSYQDEGTSSPYYGGAPSWPAWD